MTCPDALIALLRVEDARSVDPALFLEAWSSAVALDDGRLVEVAPATTLFKTPRHPYTRGLIGSVPRFDRPEGTGRRRLTGCARSVAASRISLST